MSILRRTTLVTLTLQIALGACSKSHDASNTPSLVASSDAGVGNEPAGGAGAGGEDSAAGNTATAGGAANYGGTANSNGGATNMGIAGAVSGCTPITNQVTSVPPILMFQIDITGSMELATSTTNGQSKWEATKTALANALRRLPAEWLVGVTFFNKAGSCYAANQQTTVPIAPLTAMQLNSITDAIAIQRPGGNTPTFCAWTAAASYLRDYRAAENSVYAQSEKFVVLVTDGVPTVNQDCCSLGASPGGTAVTQDEYNLAIASIRSALELNTLRTFVIGVPGSEDAQGAEYDPRCMLSQIAEAGGTALPGDCTSAPGVGACTLNNTDAYCHIDLTTSPDFSGALEEVIVNRIGHSVTSCSYPVPAIQDDNYVDAKRTTILYGEGESQNKLSAASSAACNDGDYYFQLDERGHVAAVNLCPARCAQIQANRAAKLSVQFACITIG